MYARYLLCFWKKCYLERARLDLLTVLHGFCTTIATGRLSPVGLLKAAVMKMCTSYFSYQYIYNCLKNLLQSFLPVRPAEETGYPMKPGGRAEERSANPYRKSFSSWEIMKIVMCCQEKCRNISNDDKIWRKSRLRTRKLSYSFCVVHAR
jgi:hypothetical protein